MPKQGSKNNISDAQKKRKKELARFYRVLALSVAVLFVAVFVLNLVVPDKTFSEREKRMLSKAPSVSWDSLLSGEFGSDFEEYASDQMVFRSAFVSLKTAVDGLFGKKESNGVFRGKNGWLIQKMASPSEETLNETFEAMTAFTKAYRSNYSFVLVPNASSVYAENLPLFATSEDQAAFSQTVRKGLAKAKLRYLDLTDVLMKEKAETNELLYYKTDHHWTTYSAYVSRNAVLKTLNKASTEEWKPLVVTESFTGSLASKSGFSVSTPDSISLYVTENAPNYLVSGTSRDGKTASVYSMEGLKSSDPYTVFLGGNDGFLHIETDQIGKGSLLVFKDSYFNCFLPFLLNEFETIDVVDPRYFSDDLNEMMMANKYDSVLFFYNMSTFSEDTSLSLVLNEAMRESEVAE